MLFQKLSFGSQCTQNCPVWVDSHHASASRNYFQRSSEPNQWPNWQTIQILKKKRKKKEFIKQDRAPESIHTAFVRSLPAASRFGMMGAQRGHLHSSQVLRLAPTHSEASEQLPREPLPAWRLRPCASLPAFQLTHSLWWVAWNLNFHKPQYGFSPEVWAFSNAEAKANHEPYENYTFWQSRKLPSKAVLVQA